MKKLSVLLIILACGVPIFAQNDKVQLIGIQIGNLDNMSIFEKAAFPEFDFYYNDAKLMGYSEEQKMIGNSTNLMGWYGEVPEKMGFCANYRGSYSKGNSFPYIRGVVYVVDQEGTVAYQLQPMRFTKNHQADTYYKIQNDIVGLVKKLKKGKTCKKLKARKQAYIKKSAVGEIEKSKGAKIDKKGVGITGWDLPDINVKSENGESMSLKELTKDKINIIVFFTLNGVHWMNANTKGKIIKEWDGDKLIAPSAYSGNLEKKVMDGEYEDKKEAKKAFAKTMFKSMVATSDNAIAKIIINNKEELAEVDKVKAYGGAVINLKMVQEISKKLKK
jgi:hypothetical protein